MAAKKKPVEKQAEQEPGFFSDYGYGEGSLIIHDPPQKPKGTKSGKTTKSKRK